MIWYTQSADKLYEILGTTSSGLSSSVARRLLAKYGLNQLAIKKTSLWQVIIEPFQSLFVGVLVVAAVVSLLSHELLDGVIIVAIILVNAVIFYSQQYATTRVLRSLTKHRIQYVLVLRDKVEVRVSATELVLGDIVILAEGERVPADLRVVRADNLQVNESSLTGESVPVYKHASAMSGSKRLYEQENMLFQGTYIVTGTGKAVVVATAGRTEFSKIAELANVKTTSSTVQIKIDHLLALLIRAIGFLVAIVFALSLIRGISANEALRFALSLAVSAAPEGLPVALTVVIVLGMRRMAKQKALVRSFKAIEDIGLVTTIATDKTGTLTKNHLAIVDSWTLGNGSVKEAAYFAIDPHALGSDPLDLAIAAMKGDHPGHHADRLYPFDTTLRMSGAYIASDQMIYIKGSPEHILAKSSVSPEQHHAAESAMHRFAAKGYRVIAIGEYGVSNDPPVDLSSVGKNAIDFIGYLAFADELRPEAAEAIRQAQEAGVSVRLVTGDHYETAYNIGRMVGLADHPDQVMQGVDLPEEPRALALAIRDKTVFARILPSDKFRILQALKQTEITAMTGDGVNDVPALVNANVGIAVGSGSDIAKDAAGIVLLDDNFATIVKAIAEGRKIFNNIRRMLFYLLSTSLGEVLTMIGALLFGLPLPVTAIQILWVNLVTDTAMVLPLGLEPDEDGNMKRPPRRPEDPLLSNALLVRIVLVAITIVIVLLSIVTVLVQRNHSIEYIQTVTFMALIVAQWTNAFNARSEYASSFTRLKNANYGLAGGFLVAFSLQMLVMLGPLGAVFHIQSVPVATLLYSCIIMMIAVIAVVEVHKSIVRRLIKR